MALDGRCPGAGVAPHVGAEPLEPPRGAAGRTVRSRPNPGQPAVVGRPPCSRAVGTAVVAETSWCPSREVAPFGALTRSAVPRLPIRARLSSGDAEGPTHALAAGPATQVVNRAIAVEPAGPAACTPHGLQASQPHQCALPRAPVKPAGARAGTVGTAAAGLLRLPDPARRAVPRVTLRVTVELPLARLPQLAGVAPVLRAGPRRQEGLQEGLVEPALQGAPISVRAPPGVPRPGHPLLGAP